MGRHQNPHVFFQTGEHDTVNFVETFRLGPVALALKGNDKKTIIAEMVDMLVSSGRLPAEKRDVALNAVMEREKKMSTGMQFGVAIPHGKSPQLTDFITAFAIKKEGVNFGAQDGQPCTIFVMTLSAATQVGPHMQYLAEISRLLSSDVVRARLLNAATEEEVREILTPPSGK
jgi:PTS system nitrogen regulatory IIA component